MVWNLGFGDLGFIEKGFSGLGMKALRFGTEGVGLQSAELQVGLGPGGLNLTDFGLSGCG